MSTFPKTRIRIAADLFSYTAFGDILRTEDEDYRPKFRAGDDIQFEIGLFNNGELLDLSGIAAVTLEIKPMDAELTERFDEDDDADNYDLRGPDLSLTPIRSKTLPASDLNAALTKSAWDSNAPEQCHALISLSSAESNIAAGDRWLTVGIVTGDSPGRIRTVCAGPIRVLGGGLSQAASPEGNTPETFYNTIEADARFLKLANNLSDLADASTARNNLGLGESDSPSFAGLDIDSGGVVDFNDNRLRDIGDATDATDALNRQSADARYLRSSNNGTDIANSAAFRANLSVYSRDEVNMLTTKAFSPALFLDGTAGTVMLPAAVGAAFAGTCTVAVRLHLMDGRPTSTGCLLGYSTGSAPGTSFQLLLNTNGALKLLLRDGATEASTQTETLFTDGASHEITIVATVDTEGELAALYLDGTLVATLDISELNLSAGSWGAPALGALMSGGTTAMRLAAYFGVFAIYNRVLSASEIAARFGPQPTAPLVPTVDRWGTIPGGVYASNFSAGSDGWTTGTDTVSGNIDTDADGPGHPPSDNWLKLTTDAEGALYKARQNTFSSVDDKPYRLTARIFFPATGGLTSPYVKLYGAGWDTATSGAIIVPVTPGQEVVISGIVPSTRANTTLAIASSDVSGGLTAQAIGLSLYLKDIRLTRPGVVAAYDAASMPRVGYQFHDLSPNALHGLLSTSGCTWLEAGERGRITFTGFTSDAWLGGSERALIPAGYRIAEIIATETAGVAVSNLALGTAANGTNLVSSFSLLAGETKSLTVAAPFAARSVAQPIHINDAPGDVWGGGHVSLTFIVEKF